MIRQQASQPADLSEEVSDEWMVHFVSRRNQADRSFYEREGNIPLPADGELSDEADEFDVLCAQLLRRGLIPGFPDGYARRYSPKTTIIAQDASGIDFSKRASTCGVVFRRSEFVAAGAVEEVIAGRPDLHFDGLLAWDVSSVSARQIHFRAPNYEFISALGLPLLDPSSPFKTLGVIVDSEHQATAIQELLTRQFLSLRSYVPLARQTRKLLKRAHILVPAGGELGCHISSISGLEGFSTRSAIKTSIATLRKKVLAEWAFERARAVAFQYADRSAVMSFDPDSYRTMFVGFADDGSPISKFLLSAGLAEPVDDGIAPNVCRIDIGIEYFIEEANGKAMLQAAAAALEDGLGLRFFVRDYFD
ncbi:UNVERIFIED_ORG: hypothetical protein GGE55_001662 [Rhizobium esperanzae]